MRLADGTCRSCSSPSSTPVGTGTPPSTAGAMTLGTMQGASQGTEYLYLAEHGGATDGRGDLRATSDTRNRSWLARQPPVPSKDPAFQTLRLLAVANAQQGSQMSELPTRIRNVRLLGYPTKEEVEYEPPAAATAAACLPLAEAGVSMWIGGPPGAGKSTTAFRLRR